MNKKWIILIGVIAVIAIILAAVFSGEKESNPPALSDTDYQLLSHDVSVARAAIDAHEELGEEPEINLLLRLANNYTALEEYGLASEVLEQYLEISPTNPQIWIDYGFALAGDEKLNQAENAYLQAVDIDFNQNTMRRMVDFWMQYDVGDRSEQTLQLLEAGVESFGQTPYLMTRLGEWHMLYGDCNIAVDYYEILVSISPDDAGAAQDLDIAKRQCSEIQLEN